MAVHKETLLASQDLSDVVQYIAGDNPDAASRFLEEVEETYRRLALEPAMGRERPELGEAVRSLPRGNYLIVYRPLSNGVLILRFLSGRRDVDNLL
jgi:toxin ParE1/3/4